MALQEVNSQISNFQSLICLQALPQMPGLAGSMVPVPLESGGLMHHASKHSQLEPPARIVEQGLSRILL